MHTTVEVVQTGFQAGVMPTHKVERTWAQIADDFGVNVKTIERDRALLGRFDDPISDDDLIEELRRVRRWCSLGKGRSRFTHRNYMKLKETGELEAELKRFGII